MKKIITYLFLIIFFNSFVFSQETYFDFGLKSNLGTTFTSFNTNEGEDSNLELLISLLANINYEGKAFHFDSDFFI